MNIFTSFLVTTGLLLSMSSPSIVAQAPVVPVVQQIVVETSIAPKVSLSIKDKVYMTAKKYGVSGDEMWNTMKCENRELDPKKQSGYYSNGVREESYGLVQIHLPSHPTISYAQATDVDFSITFMAQQFAKGNQNIWTCYRTVYGGR